MKTQNRIKDDCKDVINLVPYYNKVPGLTVENLEFKHFFAGFYALGKKKIETILNICAPDADRSYMGKTVTIKCGEYSLCCNKSEEDRAPLTTTKEITIPNVFVIFDLRSIYGDDYVYIFSVGASGYVFASDAQKVDDNRQVCGWSPGNPVSNGRWQIDSDKESFKEKGYGQFLYSSRTDCVCLSSSLMQKWTINDFE